MRLTSAAPPLASRLWQPAPSDTVDLLSQFSRESDRFFTLISGIATPFGLEHAAVGTFFLNTGHLLSIVREDSTQGHVEALGNFLASFQGNSQRLFQVTPFIAGYDWQKTPYRRTQTLSQVLEMALSAAEVYRQLDLELPEQPAFSPLGFEPDIRPIRYETIAHPYVLELRPGWNEVHGGLELRLTAASDLIAKIGFLIGSSSLHIVQIQGGKAFRAHQQKMKSVLEGSHPFDWLLRTLASWAAVSGYHSLVAYSYRLNPWIEKDLREGLLPEGRRDHFSKLYDERFLKFGFTPVDSPPDVFGLPLPISKRL